MPKNEAKDRPEIDDKTEGTISRRSVLKIGAAAGAAGVLAPSMLTSTQAFAIDEPVRCDPLGPNGQPINPGPGPDHTPFVDNFTAPFPAIPVNLSPDPQEHPNLGANEAPRAPHQRWAQFPPDVEYEMIAQPGLHRFHSDFADTYVWGFNGRYPAPTVLNIYGHPSLVRFRNNLPASTTTFGRNEITIHLHNGHHGSESDGFAGDFFPPNFFKDHLYPNCYAGLDAFGGNGDPKEKMGSFWFHDHRAEFTLNNNFLGLNGMFIVYDNTDPGHEFNTAGSLRLPGYYGITDFPLILADKRFCNTLNGRTEMVNSTGGTNKWIVNGKIQPKMTVRRRKYRFRILNTGPTRDWNLTLIKGNAVTNAQEVQTITVIATDANFLEHPLKIDAGANSANSNTDTAPIIAGGLRVSVAERYDIIIDFSQYTAGSKLYLKENGIMRVNAPINPPGPNVPPPGENLPTGLDIGQCLMRFDVVEREWWFPPDTPAIPDPLCTYPDPTTTDAEFEFQFVRDQACPGNPPLFPANFTVNVPPRQFRVRRPLDEFGNPLDGPLGCIFDADDPAHCIHRGDTEEWTLNNNVGGSAWTHPIHIHFEEFRTLKRFVNGAEVPVPPLMTGRKDVSRLQAGQGARIKMQFRDYNGRYLIHCHNMAHEDAFMMVRWDICPDQASFDACIADRQVCQDTLQCEPPPP